MRTPERSGSDRIHGTRLLLFVIGCLALAYGVQALLVRLAGHGTVGSIRLQTLAFFHVQQGTDSWLPMMKSLDYFHDNPALPIYGAHLYDTLIYSLASLLPLALLRHLGLSDAAMLRTLAWLSWLAVWGVAALCIAQGRQLLHRRGSRLDWQTILAILLATIFSYPLIKGYFLGNAQTFLSLGFALLLYLWTAGRERESGVLAALMAFVKPQYGLFLIWAAVRRRWGAAAAFLICAAVLLLASIAVFGLHNNLDYIAVLASLSHKAQTHYGNQSMFGTLNRVIGNGENLGYTPNVYTPYIPWVYRVTVLTSLALIALVLGFPWGKLRASTADLAAMGLASVAASPMAWEHHYGIVLPIFAWAWFSHLCTQDRRPWLWALSFLLCNFFLFSTLLLAPHRGWNILQSSLYAGVLLLMALLMKLARNPSPLAPAPTPTSHP